MSYKVLKIEEKLPQPAILPDGKYTGIWGGYIVEIKVNNKTYELTSEEGVRGSGIKVIVEIVDGKATFEETKN